jgi:hypothetical protein
LAGRIAKAGHHTIGVTNAGMMSRIWMINRRSFGRRTHSDEQAQGKDNTHLICSIDRMTQSSKLTGHRLAAISLNVLKDIR